MSDGLSFVFGDLHEPFTCPDYKKAGLSIIKDTKPKRVISIGDAIDCWQISDYSKDPSRRERLYDDVMAFKATIEAWVDAMQPGTTIHLVQGNHESRLDRFIAKNCHPIHEFVRPIKEMLDIENLGRKKRIRIIWHPEEKWDSLVIGDCLVTHGEHFDKHVAANNLDRYWDFKKVLHGHVHRSQLIYRRDRWAATIGCGAEPRRIAFRKTPGGSDMSYAMLNTVRGITGVEIVPFISGRAYFRGMFY